MKMVRHKDPLIEFYAVPNYGRIVPLFSDNLPGSSKHYLSVIDFPEIWNLVACTYRDKIAARLTIIPAS
jgi:hypothetical protein